MPLHATITNCNDNATITNSRALWEEKHRLGLNYVSVTNFYGYPCGAHSSVKVAVYFSYVA